MIWLIGNKGMLGTELSLLLEKKGIPFIGTDREVDITNLTKLRDFSKKYTFEWIINCAAYTAVDRAEDDIENCRRINVEGPFNIAIIVRESGSKFIHISTDYVFNGMASLPYTEEDATDPIGVYGLSKRDGEIKALMENDKTYIIRTAWLYGKYGHNFVHTMLRLMKEKGKVSVVNDQRGSPTWARDLSETIIVLINEEKLIPYGIFHFTNEGEISWFDFVKEIHKQALELGILIKDCELLPCTSKDFSFKVKRPAYSVLDKNKIKNTLCVTIPGWKESLNKFLVEYA